MDRETYRNWRDLIKPKALVVDKDSLTQTYGKFFAEPLERGFGITLGNALRRVLLSSLQGAAVTSIKVDGALHEFTALPGITEDVADIILNLKDLLIKMRTYDQKTLRLDKKGPTVVRASDIETDSTVEILNKDLVIATVGEDGHLKMEMTCKKGRGYVQADANKVGTDQGSCVRTVPGKAWECTWTAFLPDGQVVVQGPFYDDGSESTLAIIGGTGKFTDASGEMVLGAGPNATEYTFTYKIDD